MKILRTGEFSNPSVGGRRRMNPGPKVSVVMSVYNAERYLREAVESILNQTFQNFEFLIINDGSRDRSEEIIRSYKDSRIRFISRENKGLVTSLNEGIAKARGRYIARQDADDASRSGRLDWEVGFLDKNPDVGMVGSNYIITNEEGRKVGETCVFTNPNDLKVALAVSNQFGHGSVMIRKSVLEKVGDYDPKAIAVEDYDLWTRISRVSKVANIKEPLYLWRRRAEGISLSNQGTQIRLTREIANREFQNLLRNRNQYKVFTSWHPTTFGHWGYFRKKSDLFRNVAYSFRINGKVGWAYLAIILAIVLAPWRIRNYFYFLILPSLEEVKKNWRYVYL